MDGSEAQLLSAFSRADSRQWGESQSEDDDVDAILHISGRTDPLRELNEAIDEVEEKEHGTTFGYDYYDDQSLETGQFLDMQGIHWTSVQAREDYQAQRFAIHQPFHNVPHLEEDGTSKVDKQCNRVYRPEDAQMLQFHRFSRQAAPCHFHFQLRNLLASASAYEYYYLRRNIHSNSVMLFNAAADTSSAVIDFQSDKRDAVKKYRDVVVSTLTWGDDLLLVGGFNGETLLSSTLTGGCSSTRVDGTGHESNIVNAAEISRSSSGALQVVLSTNCNSVCIYNAQDLSIDRHIGLEWPANYASVCPTNSNLLAIVGDDCSGLLYDTTANQQVAKLDGHLDFCFATAWHPDGNQLVTGSQDKSTRIWDPRKLDKAVDVLKCTHAEVRSLRYSPDGKFLAVAEPLDVVNVYDTSFCRRQRLSLLGDISGIAFSPDSSTLMLAMHDSHYGGMAEFIVHNPLTKLTDPMTRDSKTEAETEVQKDADDQQMAA